MPQIQTTPNLLANAPCHATISCTDIVQAKQFYVNVLGLGVIEEDPQQGIMLSAGDTRILVYPRDEPPAAVNTVASFTVSDVQSTVDSLRGNGVVFEEYDLPGLETVDGIAQFGSNYGAWFKDPDGNILAISDM